jgi:hypothetical protein
MPHMPEELQKIIQDFARPTWTRKDWKTCQKPVADLVRQFIIMEREKLYYSIGWGDIRYEVFRYIDDVLNDYEFTDILRVNCYWNT